MPIRGTNSVEIFSNLLTVYKKEFPPIEKYIEFNVPLVGLIDIRNSIATIFDMQHNPKETKSIIERIARADKDVHN